MMNVMRQNALMLGVDSCRSLLNQFDTTIESWKRFNYLEFIVIALEKIKKIKNIKV